MSYKTKVNFISVNNTAVSDWVVSNDTADPDSAVSMTPRNRCDFLKLCQEYLQNLENYVEKWFGFWILGLLQKEREQIVVTQLQILNNL